MAVDASQIGRCTPGNECKQTVENAIEIRNIKEDVTEIKTDVKDIRKEISKIIYGVAATVILMLAQWLWPYIKN